MTATLPFALPTPADADMAPEWTGTAFALGNQQRRVLAFDVGPSRWHSALTPVSVRLLDSKRGR